MAKRIMAVFSNPTSPETEDEYNRWYDEVHMKEVLSVPGVVSATRYRLAESGMGPSEHRYLAIYEVEGSPQEILAELGARSSPTSPALDAAGSRLHFWEPVTFA